MPTNIKPLSELEKSLGVEYKDKGLLEKALTHRSYLNEARERRESNERLEFLGDSILSFLVSKHLFGTYTDLPEGELTNLRSSIVRTTTLATIAKQLDLGSYLFLSKGEEEGGGRNNSSLLADGFESIVGSMFLDRGIEVVEPFISRLLLPLLPDIISNRSYIDFKSELQEKVQELQHISPLYKVLKEEGPDHAKQFTVGVFIQQENLGTGQGKSKQEAEQDAARVALENFPKTR